MIMTVDKSRKNKKVKMLIILKTVLLQQVQLMLITVSAMTPLNTTIMTMVITLIIEEVLTTIIESLALWR